MSGRTSLFVQRAALAGTAVWLGANALPAASVDGLAEKFEERIAVSMQAYRDQSARIADEKVPLLREINRLEDENLALREQIERAQRLTAENNTSFDALRNRVEGMKAQTEFAQRFLAEYLASFETRLHTAEDQRYKPDLTRLRALLDATGNGNGGHQTARLQHHLAALELGLKRAESVIGGYRFAGKALADGVLQTGEIAVYGPTAFFSSVAQGGDVHGLAQFNPGTIEPKIAVLPGSAATSVRSHFENRRGSLPLDATLGGATAAETTNLRIRDHVDRGGPVGYAILVLGFAALVLTVVKLFDIARFRSVGHEQLEAIIRDARNRNEPGAVALAHKVGGPMGEMLEIGVRHIRGNLVLLEELMLSVVLRRRPDMERFLPFLAITVVAAPLLGLLGTVVGMIRTFALITIVGTGNPRALSSGISEALITTEFGLMVAIPVLVMHAILTRMIKSRFGDMERVAFEFVKTVSLEDEAAKAAHPATPTPR